MNKSQLFVSFLLISTICRGQQSSSQLSIGQNEPDEEDTSLLIEEAASTRESTSSLPRAKTLKFSKELRNITREAGDYLRLRCEVEGSPPVTSFDWYKNDAPLIEEKNRMKIKNKVRLYCLKTNLNFD